MKILIADDDMDDVDVLRDILEKGGYEVEVAGNGMEALGLVGLRRFDALLTDWLMPKMDGMELIRRIRARGRDVPLIFIVTGIRDEYAREYALQAGADGYIIKPYGDQEVLTSLEEGLARMNQPSPELPPAVPVKASKPPPFVGVVVGASTGGPPALMELFQSLPNSCDAAFFVVQHGPPWMLKTFARNLDQETGFKFRLAEEGMIPKAGEGYLAPGDRHLGIRHENGALELKEGPKENFVRPAVDPLLQSAVHFFGRYGIAVILTGLGRDGTRGAALMKSAGGRVWVQDPQTAVAPFMPESVAASGNVDTVLPVDEMGPALASEINHLSRDLKSSSGLASTIPYLRKKFPSPS